LGEVPGALLGSQHTHSLPELRAEKALARKKTIAEELSGANVARQHQSRHFFGLCVVGSV
jgi:hypothetical protein